MQNLHICNCAYLQLSPRPIMAEGRAIPNQVRAQIHLIRDGSDLPVTTKKHLIRDAKSGVPNQVVLPPTSAFQDQLEIYWSNSVQIGPTCWGTCAHIFQDSANINLVTAHQQSAKRTSTLWPPLRWTKTFRAAPHMFHLPPLIIHVGMYVCAIRKHWWSNWTIRRGGGSVESYIESVLVISISF